LSPVWRRDVPPVLVLAASFLLPCCAPPTPKYDGIRLFLPAAAGLAVMGGMGMDRVARWLESVLRIPTPLTALGVSLLSAGSLVSVHPHYLSYYSPTVGGLPGAERLGFELTYWGECLGPEVLRTLNEEHGVRLLLADPVGGNVCPLSERMGLVPEDMKMRRLAEGAGEGPAARTTKEGTAVALVCRQGKFDEGLWRLYRRETPFKTVSAGDTALVRFYTQEQWDRAQGSGSGEVRP